MEKNHQPDSALFQEALVAQLDYVRAVTSGTPSAEEERLAEKALDAIWELEHAEGPEVANRLWAEGWVKLLIDMEKLGLAHEFIAMRESVTPLDPTIAAAIRIFKGDGGHEQ
jgi:hypothetical protein